MDNETLISADTVSKKFCRTFKKSLWYGVQDLSNEIRGRRHGGDGQLRSDEFWAAKDISFDLSRGECLGLIGRNGAGKTTLLRMLNGLIKPDTGRIEMSGRVGALIALGAGFNPILTGRENIYVNASVLGLKKHHVDRRIDEIIDFSGIGEFIDMPVQSYSSGMTVRLGFSVAAILIEPDILFLDEVLAVGDIGFTIKCLNVVRRLTQQSAVVFVSHNMQYVSSYCTRVMVLERGQVVLDATSPADGIDRYYSLIEQDVQISGTGEAQVKSFDLLSDGVPVQGVDATVRQGTDLVARLHIHICRTGADVSIVLFVMDEAMTPIQCVPVLDSQGERARFSSDEFRVDLPLGAIELAGGKYSFVVGINDYRTKESLARIQGLHPFRVFAEKTYWGKIIRPAIPLCVEELPG